MKAETKELQERVCEYIKERSKTRVLPYLCIRQYFCVERFDFGDKSYCGKILRVVREEAKI